LLRAVRTAAIARGVTYVAEDASEVCVSGDQVCDVRTAQGGRYAADWVVNAAGAQSACVARWLGIDLPVGPRKRTVFHFKAPLDGRAIPMLFDTSGAWFRPEGDGFIGGIQPDSATDIDADGDFEPHHDLFEERFWPLIAARVPAFEQLRLRNAWAGHYEMNLFDHNGVVGPHSRFRNLLFASGFSGHGVMHAPGVARGVAELIVSGGYRTLDLSTLHYDRIANDLPMLEDAIY
jgi:FAD-dependent oxidoreductase domain-containing protein 1